MLTRYDKRDRTIDLLDEVGPASLSLLRNEWRGGLRDLGRFFFDILLFSLSPLADCMAPGCSIRIRASSELDD